MIDSGPDSAPGRLRTRVGLALFIAMVGLWLAPIGPVLAAALPVPAGWEQGPNAAPDARRRAEAWAAAWGGSVRHVITPSGRDDFAETLVVVDVSRPMPADAFGDPAVATAWLQRQAATALGATASVDETSVEQIPWTTPGVTVLVGRVIVESRAARIAFAPRGPSHVVVMLLVTASEEVLYADLFDETVDALEGLRPPVVAFSTGRWRGVAIVLWLLVAGIATVLWTRRNLPQPGARAAGRQVAAVLGIAALAVFVLVGLALDTASVELSLAGSSPWGMAAELGAVGLAAAGLAIVGTELWERRLQPIVSAPRAGSFASGGSPSPRRATALRAAMPGEPPPPAVDPWQGATVGGLATSHPPPDSGGTAVGPAPTNVPVPLPSDVNTAPIPVPSHHDASGGTPRPSQVPTDRLAPVPHDIGRAPRSLPSDIPTDRLASMPHDIGRAPGSLPTDRLAPMPHDIGRAPGSLPSDIPTDRLAPVPRDIGRASDSLPSDIPTDRLAPVPRDIGRASGSLPSDIPTDRLAPVPRDIGRAPGSLAGDIPTDRLAAQPVDLPDSFPSDIPTDRGAASHGRPPSSPLPAVSPVVTGQTKVGPPPTRVSAEDYDAGPPVRDVISGDIEIRTLVRPNPVLTGPFEDPASLIDAHDPPPEDPPVDPTASGPAHSASGSGLFPAASNPRGPSEHDSHPALDMPLPPRDDS